MSKNTLFTNGRELYFFIKVFLLELFFRAAKFSSMFEIRLQ